MLQVEERTGRGRCDGSQHDTLPYYYRGVRVPRVLISYLHHLHTKEELGRFAKQPARLLRFVCRMQTPVCLYSTHVWGGGVQYEYCYIQYIHALVTRHQYYNNKK